MKRIKAKGNGIDALSHQPYLLHLNSKKGKKGMFCERKQLNPVIKCCIGRAHLIHYKLLFVRILNK